jgi:hypothetical protein
LARLFSRPTRCLDGTGANAREIFCGTASITDDLPIDSDIIAAAAAPSFRRAWAVLADGRVLTLDIQHAHRDDQTSATEVRVRLEPLFDAAAPVRDIAAGCGFLLLLDARGRVWLWGRDPRDLRSVHRTPVAVALPAPVREIAAVGLTAAALDAAASVWLFGRSIFDAYPVPHTEIQIRAD